jgi:site-specific recombinase XerC
VGEKCVTSPNLANTDADGELSGVTRILSKELQGAVRRDTLPYTILGITPRTIQLPDKKVANGARISRTVRPHVLRHPFAVAAVQKGISLLALQRLLGHDRLTTTEIYLNLSLRKSSGNFEGSGDL